MEEGAANMRREKISNAKVPIPGKARPPAAAFEQQSSYSKWTKSQSIRLHAVKKPSMHFASETHSESKCSFSHVHRQSQRHIT